MIPVPFPRKQIGMLTPSSNTVLEPMTAAMLAGLPDVTAHFGRFRVTEISLGEKALAQFDDTPILAAAELLADARTGAIVWNGTSASWLGLDTDRRLCARIEERTGAKAGTSVLALMELFRAMNVGRYGLVSPYLDDVQAKIVANFEREGLTCAAERHTGERVNYAFAEIDEATIARLIRDVAAAKPDAIVILCTNMRGGKIAAELERELGIPVLDTVATAVWAGLRLIGQKPSRVQGWGRLFEIP
ncbi:aspartate/glutamate racemase family protein [Halotia wernerae UHCC 0503]|jgi:maleate isomerase|nr:aspartate/glutamate racemase family protein [Halotia wernerae UHCC 0503]